MAKLEARDIDCIIFCTLSPDYTFPGSGVLLQRRLGLSDATIPAFDLRNQCSGYLYALQVADAFIRTGTYRRVLVAGAEVHSSGIEHADRGRDVTVIFGDGAGVTILGPTEEEGRGLLSVHCHSQGEHAEQLYIECPSSRVQPCRATHDMIESGRIFPKMNGKFVFKHATTRLPEVIREALDRNEIKAEDVSLFLFHQANLRINQFVAAGMGIGEDRVPSNIQKYGNLSAGAIPALLDECVRGGRVKRGDLVCLAAFGSGFTWASALVRW
jgi:3-oxoacyl-[acyl-carrier-protein] synthase-3